MEDDFWNGCISLIVVVGLLVVIILVLNGITNASNGEGDKKCKEVLGADYSYVNGVKSPSLCATKEGKTIYYDLIK